MLRKARTATLFLAFCVSASAQVSPITEFPIPTPLSGPNGIAVGPDGALWFTEESTSKIGRIDTTGARTEYPTRTPNSEPHWITTGPDGALWYTASNAGKIVRMTTAGAQTEYPLPAGYYAWWITLGPDNALWITVPYAHVIGRMDTTGSFTEYAVPNSGIAWGIIKGPDGALWFADRQNNKIGRITTTGSIQEYPVLTSDSGLTDITVGPDGALWFTEIFANKIGRITTDGLVTEYSIPTSDSGPSGITKGPDDALWFTEYKGNNIGRITTAGSITEYPIPTPGSVPYVITNGPDGDHSLWFTETHTYQIGRLRLPFISGLNPGSVSAAGSAFTLTVNGSNFVPGAVIQWGGVALTPTTFSDSTQLSALVPTAYIAQPASVPITVSQFGVVSNSQMFSIGAAKPSITGLNPSSATAGGPAFTLTINGTNLAGGFVTWNSTSLTVLSTSANQISATVPAALIAQAGPPPATITVSTAGGSATASFTVNPGSSACAYSLSASSLPLTASGGSGGFTVMTAPGCPFTAVSNTSNPNWLMITSGGGGSLNGQVTFDAAANNSSQSRSGTITVTGTGTTPAVTRTFTVNQSPPTDCSITLSSTTASFQSSGATGAELGITTACGWTASATGFLTIPGAKTGTGPGKVVYNVGANSTGAPRSATITVSAGNAQQTLTVNQDAAVNCLFSLSNLSLSAPAAGGGQTVTLTAPSSCQWTASSGAAWIHSDTGGTGPAKISLSFDSTSGPRTGTITIAGQTITVNQSAPSSFACTASAAQVPSVRIEGTTELTGDYLLNCTGSAPNGITADVLVTFNTNVTNRTIDTAGTLDALLLINDPSPPVVENNAFRGRLASANQIRFANVPIAAVGSNGPVKLRLTNARVDASLSGATPVQITASAEIRSAQAPIVNASQIVALASSGISASIGSAVAGAGQFTLPVQFKENQANAFKIQLAPNQDPSAPGTVYNSESGFVSLAALGLQTGVATSGTRLLLTLKNVPGGVQVFAPVFPTSVSPSGSATAQLVNQDPNGAGVGFVQGAPQFGGTYQELTISNGAATATWEVTSASANAIETFNFNLVFLNANSGTFSQLLTSVSPAPVAGTLAAANVTVPQFLSGPPGQHPALLLRVKGLASQGSTGTSSGFTTSGGPGVPPRTPEGRTVAVEIQTANDTAIPAMNTKVAAALPKGTRFGDCNASDGGGTCTGTGLGFEIKYQTLNAGQSAKAVVTLIVDDTAACASLSQIDLTASSDRSVALDSLLVGVSGLKPSAAGFLSSAGGNSFQVFACGQWSATSQTPWIHLQPTATITGSGPGSQIINYNVDANTGTTVRSGQIKVTMGSDAQYLDIAQDMTPPSGKTSIRISNGGQSYVADPQGNAWISDSNFCGGAAFTSTATIAGATTQQLYQHQRFSANPFNCTFTVPNGGYNVTLKFAELNGATTNLRLFHVAINDAPVLTNFDVFAAAGGVNKAVDRTFPVNVTAGQIKITFTPLVNNAIINAIDIESTIVLPPVNSLFVPLPPCRVVDTRQPPYGLTGAFGPPSLVAGAARSFAIPTSVCPNIPANAAAYSLNVTVATPGALGFLTVWPTGQPQPNTSTLNTQAAATVANAAIVPAGTGGAISVFATNPTDVLIDINGYFIGGSASALAFYPVSPCRAVDTRQPPYGLSGQFGPPTLNSGTSRSFPLPSTCGLPPSALAYSVNVTAVPQGSLPYITTYPSGQSPPNASTLNSFNGDTVANAAIVPAGSNGAISVYAAGKTDVIIDVNGYFAAAGGPNGVSFYTLTPCRVFESRSAYWSSGSLGPGTLTAAETRTLPIPSAACGAPSSAKAYSMNVTVVPPGPLQYLTAWQTGGTQPNVSTLNSFLGNIVANAAIVSAGTNGAINVFVTNPTDVILDINGYFAQ